MFLGGRRLKPIPSKRDANLRLAHDDLGLGTDGTYFQQNHVGLLGCT